MRGGVPVLIYIYMCVCVYITYLGGVGRGFPEVLFRDGANAGRLADLLKGVDRVLELDIRHTGRVDLLGGGGAVHGGRDGRGWGWEEGRRGVRGAGGGEEAPRGEADYKWGGRGRVCVLGVMKGGTIRCFPILCVCRSEKGAGAGHEGHVVGEENEGRRVVASHVVRAMAMVRHEEHWTPL